MIGLRALFTGFLLASAAVATCGAANAPPIAVNSVEVTGDQDDCLLRASSAMKKNSFGTAFSIINDRTLNGQRGAYTAAVRCVAEKGVAFVAVAGPSTDLTEKYAEAIRNGF
jgi:hypothetical protein